MARAHSAAESVAAPFPPAPPPTTSQRSISSGGSPAPVHSLPPPPPPPPPPAKDKKADKQQSGGALRCQSWSGAALDLHVTWSTASCVSPWLHDYHLPIINAWTMQLDIASMPSI